KMAGGPDLREFVKDAGTGYKQDAGSYYTNPLTGQKTFMPTLDKGMTMLGDGSVAAVPGFAQANAGINAANAGAVELAQQQARFPFDIGRQRGAAGLDIVQMPGSEAGRTIPMTRLALAEGGMPQTQNAPQQMPQLPQNVTFGGSLATDPRRQQAAMADYTRSMQAPTQANAGAGMAQQRPREFGQSTAEAAFAAETQKGQAKGLLDSRESASNARDSIYTTQQARELLKTNPITGTGADFRLSLSKAGKTFFGVELDPQQVSNSEYLRSILGGRVLDQAKALGANPSNTDRDFIKEIVGTLANDPGAMGRLLDFQEHLAWRGIDSYNRQAGEAMQRNPGAYTTDPRINFGAIRPLPPKQFTRDLNAGSQYRLPDGRVGTWNGQGFEVQ
ncbi:MAG: hypothetical protein ACRCV9_03475, partial [Burkholderiaceae bacterium]